MTGREILQLFGLKTETEPVSIYPFSPVYRVELIGKEMVIKKTQRPLEKAERLFHYTTSLKARGIDIVTPAAIAEDNPQEAGEDVYVAYPFIEGGAYRGGRQEIYEAGKLLGSIHALSPETNTFSLPEYEVFDFTVEEVQESVVNIKAHALNNNFELDACWLEELLNKAVEEQSRLQAEGLPSIATPHDYKANNLIFTPQPYLIDPDNAAWIPRIFDLALALLLFHNELESAPDAVFTPDEWKLFLSGYKEHIEITASEEANWEKAINHVFLDEVMWLMAEVDEDWERASQRSLFRSILQMMKESQLYRL